MITYIKINGFKSFHQFEMEFTPFTVIAGANASGKSNLFDALKLLSRLAETDNLKRAFKEQRGEFMELFTQYEQENYASEMEFVVEMLINRNIQDAWGNETQVKYTRLHYELKIRRIKKANSEIEDLEVIHEKLLNLKHQQDQWIKLIPKEHREHWRPPVKTGRRSKPYLTTELENNIPTVFVSQDGTNGNRRRFVLKNATRTVLSSFDTIDFPHVFAAREEMRSWKFLQMNPNDLRKPTSKDIGDDIVSESGENLAGALSRIQREDTFFLTKISQKLQSFLPHFMRVEVVDDRENKQYLIKLTDKNKKSYTSRVLSEGTLRILALCILEYDAKHTGLLCFEEPENGIHPFRMKDMIQLLKDLSIDFSKVALSLRQVIVNTHSPVIVGNIYQWNDNPLVKLYYVELINSVVSMQNIRVRLTNTKASLVSKVSQLPIENLEPRQRLTISTVKEYLATAHFTL